MTPPAGAAPARPNRVLLGAFLVALAVNLALLLLIGALIRRGEAARVSAPDPHPIEFMRILPRPEPPKAEEPEPKPEAPRPVAAAPRAPAQAPRSRPAPERRAAKPAAPLRRPAPASAPRRARTEPAGVPAPRLDIPAQGTGAPFAPVPGSDSRLTGPPAQWNPDKQPGTPPAPRSDRKEGDDGGGSASQALVVVSRVLPDYPPRARHQGIEGWVRLEIEVTPAGTVGAARVVDAKPRQIFDEAALAAIRRWRFKPAFREGRAVGQRARLTINFKLRQQ